MRTRNGYSADDSSHVNAVMAIRGMVGQRCVSSVRSALTLIRGVNKVDISLETGRAAVSFDPSKAEVQQFKVAVKAVGFQADVVEHHPA